MAINDDKLERDPRLARLYQAASGEEPPAVLDAAILAAARREVGARPRVAGGETSIPSARAKRNWYMPVSIAAVLVLSVSLVTLVHQEKGDELAQPPTTASAPPKTSDPVAAPAAEPPAATSAKEDGMLRDAAPAKPKVAEQKRAEAAKAAAAPEAFAELAKKQRTEKLEAADGAAAMPEAARKDQYAGAAAREQGPASDAASVPRTGPGAAMGGFSAGTQSQAQSQSPMQPAPARERRPEPFPAVTGEREAQAPASRDAAEARTRTEADRNLMRGPMQEAPVASVAPPPPVAAAPRRAAPADDALAQSAPAPAEGRVAAAPPPAAKPASPPAKAAARLMAKRAPLWRGLEDQPPEKWLERLAEFKRDGRPADADELLAEFRRRFPDHPASAR